MRNQLSQRDDFYPQIVKLVIPIIIQNLLSAAVNSADVIMLNFVGQSSISAVSLAANYSNVLFIIHILWNRSITPRFIGSPMLMSENRQYPSQRGTEP